MHIIMQAASHSRRLKSLESIKAQINAPTSGLTFLNYSSQTKSCRLQKGEPACSAVDLMGTGASLTEFERVQVSFTSQKCASSDSLSSSLFRHVTAACLPSLPPLIRCFEVVLNSLRAPTLVIRSTTPRPFPHVSSHLSRKV